MRVDEMTGTRAKERVAGTKPMRPGQVERVEFEYKRHGTPCPIGTVEVATGQAVAPTVRATRGGKDFAEHIRRAAATGPGAAWVFVADNRTAHPSATSVLWVASPCGVTAEPLGGRGGAAC